MQNKRMSSEELLRSGGFGLLLAKLSAPAVLVTLVMVLYNTNFRLKHR